MLPLLGDVGYRRLKFRFRHAARVRPVALVPAVRLRREQGCTDTLSSAPPVCSAGMRERHLRKNHQQATT